MPSSGESEIDLRGRIARTSLPFSAGGMTTFAGAGAARGAGLGASIGLAGDALRAAGSLGASGFEPTTAGGGTGSLLGGVVRAALSSGGVVESLCLTGSVLASAVGLDFLDSIVGEGVRFLERAGADASARVVFFLEFDPGEGAFSSLCGLRELLESFLSGAFVEGGEDGVGSAARLAEFEDRECEGAGGISGCDSSVSGSPSTEGASSVSPAGAEEVASPRTAGGAEGAVTGGRMGLPMLRRRFSIGAYPAVSPRMKLMATNTNPNMAN